MRGPGIYFIRCRVSGKTYVGSAYNMKRRTRQHICALEKGIHGSVIMQRSWAKHGGETFEVGVLEDVLDKTQLVVREQWWIDNSPSEFNISRVAGRVTGFCHSDEERQRISERARAKWADPEFKASTTARIRAGITPESRAALSEAHRARGTIPPRRARPSR